MSTRDPLRKLQLSHSKFLSVAEMVRKACDPVKPTFVSRLAKNSENFDEIYTELYHDFRMYKLEADDPEFNGMNEDGNDKFAQNDSWMESIKEEYFELAEKADMKLQQISDSKVVEKEMPAEETEAESKVLLRTKKITEERYKAEHKSIADSVTLISNTVRDLPDNSIGVVQGQAIRGSLHDISARVDNALQVLFEKLASVCEDSQEDQIRMNHLDFISMQRARIDSVEMAVVSKAKEVPVAAFGHHGGVQVGGAGKTFLRKVDPPKFSGEILDYPEFKRKWTANVTREKLEEEAELDRLRDNIPDAAQKMLIGEKSLANAWKILTKMYGNKTMLANKLKGKLKTIKSQGREEHDVVINLAIEVKGIIQNLSELNMQDMLKYDDEYLSAIYKALPTRERDKWLSFEKDSYGSEWEAMEVFLEDIREKATNSKVLLTNYAANDSVGDIKCKRCQNFGHKKADCPEPASAYSNAALTKTKKEDTSDEDDDNEVDDRDEEYRKKLKVICGKCPLCKAHHTYRRTLDRKLLPSDRFSSCLSFRKMSEKDRAEVLSKFKSCARCLSWRHDRTSADCKAPKQSCDLVKVSGNKCSGDHSRMVCGSGNAYCASAKIRHSGRSASTGADLIVTGQDLDADVVMLLEDIPVKLGDRTGSVRAF